MQTTRVDENQSPRSSTRLRAIFATLAMVLVALAIAFAWIFIQVGFRQYDDEGYVMISMREFLDGKPLYDVVFSQYGPFFYLSHTPVYSIAGLSHDSVRIWTVVLWLVIAGGCALLARRVGGEAYGAGAAAAFSMATLILDSAAYEPGHPQSLCGLLTIGALLATTLDPRYRRTAALLLGAAVAALLMTKINLGVFVAAAGLLALLSGERENRVARVASYFAAAGVLALPPILMRDFLTSWGLACCLFIEAAMVPMIASALAGPVRLQPRTAEVPWFVGAIVAGTAIIATVTLAMGTTPKGLWDGLVAQHIHFATAFNLPPRHLSNRAVVLALPGMLVGLAYAAGFFRSRALIRALKIGYVAGVLLVGLGGWSGGLLFFGLPWSWLILAVESATIPMSRATLGLATPIIVLMAYPVAGSQLSFAALPLLVCASVCGADVLRSLNAKGWSPQLLAAAVWALAMASLGIHIYLAIGDYQARVPLDLPGASYVRVLPEDAAIYRWLAERLQADCDTFVTLPGLNSLYFWSEKAPPTALNATTWMLLLTDARQAEIVAALEQRVRVMAVRNHKQLEFWLKDRSIRPGPLQRYIESMEVVGSRGDYELLMRPTNSSDVAPASHHQERK